MTTIIKPKRSEVAASVPTTSDLSTGEIAINSTDGKMYIKDSGNVIREIGRAGAVRRQTATNVSYNTTNDIELNGSSLIFEGITADAFETTFRAEDPTSDRTINLPDQSGTVAMVGDTLAYSIVFGS